MEGGEDNCNEDIDDFYVVDSWSEKPNRSEFNNAVGRNNLTKEEKLLRRKPTEGEIDEFLENLKQSNSNCGTSGLEGNNCNSFNSWNRSGNLLQIPEGNSRDKLCVVKDQAAKQSSKPVERFKHSIVSYKPGETLTKTFFSETSINDLSRSYNNNQKINIPSSDPFFHVSIDRNEDSGGGFSDVKGTQYTNGPFDSTVMDSSSRHPRRGRSRSPYGSSASRYSPVRENSRFPPREGGRNHSHLDNLRTDRNVIQDRRYEDMRRHRRSRSRSRERRLHRRRSYERRSSRSLSPSHIRESVKHNSMESRQMPSPYYQSAENTMPLNYSYMKPNPNLGFSTPGPVQYPVNPLPSCTSYGNYPGYNAPANNLFNNSHTQSHPFQPQIPQNQFPDPQNYNLYNPPNPVSYPNSWNQSSPEFSQNYSVQNVSADAVMYPHLKIGKPRVDSSKSTYRESLEGSSPQITEKVQRKSSVEKRVHSTPRSPDHKKHKRKPSKRRSKSPVKSSRYDSKKPKMIIDPNRIPTPPPPPIVGSYENDKSKKLLEQKVKTNDEKQDADILSDFMKKENLSLSCLLEAVMETSGQGKSRLSDPKVKKEIISNCESKIQHLYKRRMTGLGAFIPDPVQSSHVIANASPLITVYSAFTYNCEEENSEWHCPDILVPEVKIKKDLKVFDDKFTTSQLPVASEIHFTTNSENPSVIPTLSTNQSSSESNWNSNKPRPVENMFPNAYVTEHNQQSMFNSHPNPQTWSNPVHTQNPYPVQPPVLGSTNEYSFGPTPYVPPPSYSFPHRPPDPPFMPQHGYPPQSEILNYPPRMGYPPMHRFSSQNLSHPGMLLTPQPDSNRSNYQYKTDETQKLRKNKNKVNDNLILLSDNSSSHCDIAQKEKNAKNQNNMSEDILRNDGDKVAVEDPKDKLMRKVWRIRKSSEYDNILTDPQRTKEPKDKFYSKLNYAEMLEDTQLDTIHDYQLTNLRERIETCLAEGKSSPGQTQHRSRGRREVDRERDRHKDKGRGRDRFRDSERSRRGSMEDETKSHARSPFGDERKKCRSVESDANHEHPRKSKEPSDKKYHCRISSKGDNIELLTEEDHNKHKLSDSCTNEGLIDPDDHLKPSEKTLLSLILESLGTEIRKIQEKSDLYKSVIDSLDKGDKAYKRLYSFRNQTLMKSDKGYINQSLIDNRMKIVIPRDNLKEVVALIHKSFHHVQSEELSRLLKKVCYPNMLYIPKCLSKVMSECHLCVEEKKKIDEPIINQKSERKPPKNNNNRSLKVRDRDRRDSAERYKRVSKDKSLSSSSKGRGEPIKKVREKDRKDSNTNDGIPSGYEKASKVRKPGVSSDTKSNKIAPGNQSLEDKPNQKIDLKSSELLHGLNDKALEFKNVSDRATAVSEGRPTIAEEINQQSLAALNKRDCGSTPVLCETNKKNSEDNKDHDPETESSNLFPKSEMEYSNFVTKPEIQSCNRITEPEMGSLNNVTKFEAEPLNTGVKTEGEPLTTVTKSEIEPSNTVTKHEEESPITVTKSKIESSNAVTKTVIEPSSTVTKHEEEPSNTVRKPEKELSNTVTKITMESTDSHTESPKTKELVSIVPELSSSLKVDSVDKNQKPNESNAGISCEVNIPNSRIGEVSNEKKAPLDQKVFDVENKAAPKLDFKGRVRQVQMSSDKCKNIIKALESQDGTNAVDPSYLLKGGMLCRKDTTGNTIEVKIVVPSDELEKVVNIVHTMSAIHTPPAKVVTFFSKHFTQVENLDLKVNEIVSNCSCCKLKSS